MKVFESRPYQERIISKAVDGFMTNCNSILIESPTGSGKSYMSTQILMRLADAMKASEENPMKVVWIAHRSKLLTQGLMEADQAGVFTKGNVSFNPLSTFTRDKILIESLHGAHIVVYDEAQHSVSNTAVDLIQALAPKLLLGLSATPFRSDSIRLSFDAVIRDAGINRLIRDGYLSEYDMYSVDEFTPENIARVYMEDVERWGKSIVYWHTSEESERFVSEIRCLGGNTKGIYGHMSETAREEVFSEFEEGSLDVVSNVMLLTEGFDVPNLKTVFCKPSCKGLTIQMGGRALRKHEFKDVANIVQVGAIGGSDFKFPKIAHPRIAYEYKEGKWIRSGIDKDKLSHLQAAVRRVGTQMVLSGEISQSTFFTSKGKKGRLMKKFNEQKVQCKQMQYQDYIGDQFDIRQLEEAA
jgi:superfamily II DNA or RNA helicase